MVSGTCKLLTSVLFPSQLCRSSCWCPTAFKICHASPLSSFSCSTSGCCIKVDNQDGKKSFITTACHVFAQEALSICGHLQHLFCDTSASLLSQAAPAIGPSHSCLLLPFGQDRAAFQVAASSKWQAVELYLVLAAMLANAMAVGVCLKLTLSLKQGCKPHFMAPCVIMHPRLACSLTQWLQCRRCTFDL